MRTLNILVEGQTEQEFVRNLVYPYFLERGISNIRTITIETSPGFKGGDVRYEARYKSNIKQLLRGQEDLLVTSLIDYYRLRSDFPKFDESRRLGDVLQKVNLIETACAEDINDERFIPYIQLHEFEGLLFSSIRGFKQLFPDLPNAHGKELDEIIKRNPNPELINDGLTTSPSNRLIRLIPGYQKPLFGNMIALENGFDKIMEKCPRFRAWIEYLITRMKA
jgi:hypothetical protein